jgi:hypothetical protein
MADCILEHNYTKPLQESILQESVRTVDYGKGLPTVQSVGAETFDAISPHYRFALASRIVPLVYRALLPAKEPAPSVGAITSRALLYGVRPLAVPVPLIADTLRFAFAAVVILGSAALLGAAPSDNRLIVAYSVVLAASAALIGWRTARAWLKWRRLSARLGEIQLPLAQDWKEFVDVAKKDKRKYFFAVWAMLVVTVFGSAAYLAVFDYLDLRPNVPFESFAVAVLFLFGSQRWLNQQIYRMSSGTTAGEGALRFTSRVIAIAAAVGVDAVAVWMSARHSELPLVTQSIVGAAAVGLLTFISLWGWVQLEWVIACVLAGTILGGMAQYVLEYWLHLPIFDLLPTVIWMLGLGIVLPRLPVIDSDDDYGETDRPTITEPEVTQPA